jgi:hypothetical protein
MSLNGIHKKETLDVASRDDSICAGVLACTDIIENMMGTVRRVCCSMNVGAQVS